MLDGDFWNLVEASSDEKRKGEYFLRERGLEEHMKVANYLLAFKRGGGRKIKYSEVATVLRYDKRIRRCLFKYLGVIEERIRSHIFDAFRSDSSALKPTKKYEEKLRDFEGNLYEAVMHLMFSDLVSLFNKQDAFLKISVFGACERLEQNLRALVILRNQVCHNKFLLGNLELGKCTRGGAESSSLYANVKNLCCLTDSVCKESLIKEINDCSRLGSSKHDNQVRWSLPPYVVINLRDDPFFVHLNL